MWFQSTHSLRSATQTLILLLSTQIVSIHALLAECDCMATVGQLAGPCFNPRTPCGVRPALDDLEMISMWVSIHALLAECDLHGCNGTTRRPLFQSTHSLRSATNSQAPESWEYDVSIHALLAECDGAIAGSG